MANTTPVARVSAVEGQAFAKDKNGELRVLHVGDVIFEGDVLVTAAGSRIELAADDGRTLVLSSDETLTVDAEVMAFCDGLVERRQLIPATTQHRPGIQLEGLDVGPDMRVGIDDVVAVAHVRPPVVVWDCT